MASNLRFEVWIEDDSIAGWRFNACFSERFKAAREIEWYVARGYKTDLRFRTTRYQQPQHITTGK